MSRILCLSAARFLAEGDPRAGPDAGGPISTAGERASSIDTTQGRPNRFKLPFTTSRRSTAEREFKGRLRREGYYNNVPFPTA